MYLYVYGCTIPLTLVDVPVCVWMNHSAAISRTPIKNAAKAMPITVPDSNPSTTTLCLSESDGFSVGSTFTPA